jgi:hypothetical protein
LGKVGIEEQGDQCKSSLLNNYWISCDIGKHTLEGVIRYNFMQRRLCIGLLFLPWAWVSLSKLF